MGDPERYRSKAEIETWRAQDPILRFASYLKEEGLADPSQLDQVAEAVAEEIEQVMRFAAESPEPEDAALCEFVYVNPQGHK